MASLPPTWSRTARSGFAYQRRMHWMKGLLVANLLLERPVVVACALGDRAFDRRSVGVELVVAQQVRRDTNPFFSNSSTTDCSSSEGMGPRLSRRAADRAPEPRCSCTRPHRRAGRGSRRSCAAGASRGPRPSRTPSRAAPRRESSRGRSTSGVRDRGTRSTSSTCCRSGSTCRASSTSPTGSRRSAGSTPERHRRPRSKPWPRRSHDIPFGSRYNEDGRRALCE